MANETNVVQYLKTKKSTTQEYKLIPIINLSENAVEVISGHSKTISYNTNTKGEVTVSSSNNNIASVTNSGNSINITGGNTSSIDYTKININVKPYKNYMGANTAIHVTVIPGYRFGYRVRKTNPDPYESVEYLYDAVGMTPAKMNFVTSKFTYGDWQNIWFVSGNRPLMLKKDRSVDYYLDPDDYTLKEDGITMSDVSNTAYNGNAMAFFPRVWFYRYEDDNYYYEIASDVQFDSNYKAHACYNGSSYRDGFYYSLFGGSGNATQIRSLADQTRCGKLTPNQMITGAKANGDGWYVRSWVQHQHIRTLLTLMSKSLNHQLAFGNGNNQGGGAKLKTGTLVKNGQFYGVNTNKTQSKAFHCEAIWGDQWQYTPGLILSNGQFYVTATPYVNDPSVSQPVGYLDTNITIAAYSAKFITSMKCTEYGMIPRIANGTNSTYFCDAIWSNISITGFARVGGSYDGAALTAGTTTYAVNVNNTANDNTGCGLMAYPL